MGFFSKKFKKPASFDPTQLAYVAPDEPEQPAASPLGAPPPQPNPYTNPTVPSQTAQPRPEADPPLAEAPVNQPVTPEPAPVQPVTPPPAPNPLQQTPSVFSTPPAANPPVSDGKPASGSSSPVKPVITAVVVILLLAGITAGGYYGYQRFLGGKSNAANTQTIAAAPSAAPKDVLGIVDQVRKQVAGLPENETPTIATVSNLTKLQGQEFFAKAQMGDKVLIYAIARKAYLYRPSTDEIIQESEVEVAGDQDTAATASAETTTTEDGKPVLRIKF